MVTSNEDINQKFALKAFPNPTSDHLTLSYELENAAEVQIQLYSIVGQQVAEFPLAGGNRSNGRHIEQLDLKVQGIPPGMYFIRFRADDQETSIKVSVL